jgi:hypothetical protein
MQVIKDDLLITTLTEQTMIYGSWFYGGVISMFFNADGAKTISFYGIDINNNKTLIRIVIIADGIEEGSVVFEGLNYRNLSIEVSSSESLEYFYYRIEEELDVLDPSSSSVKSKSTIVDNSVLCNLQTLKERLTTFRFPRAKKEVVETLLQKKVYLDEEVVQITSRSPFEESGTTHYTTTITTLEVINV